MTRALGPWRGWVLATALWALPATAQAPGRRSLGPLETLPLVKVEDDGTTSPLRLGAFQEGPVILYFYGEDCGECTEHLAYLQRLQRTTASFRRLRIFAVAVRFGARRERPPLTLGEVTPVVDEGGKLWSQLLALPAVDSPPGARETSARVLPVTVFVGRWLLRNYGTARVPLDRYVSRRTMLLSALSRNGPAQPEVDIEDEEALTSGDWTLKAPDGGTPR